ncbi:transporter substrate-binding domain-containing protein [Streptomyces iconiensis]|uniref:Transporter substrate-binding domain-containing protein n=1 Tax=Streptomyces iconiensis TaxID=1384038 RepID=A0ABT7A803_9ACTN|nr:transporter substrate-binding domain-containing protein [Streptomyces iconiensis]MDJ1137461.1 transporter substrate-binding domain-containing protein [Streptomyces iconiensis]
MGNPGAGSGGSARDAVPQRDRRRVAGGRAAVWLAAVTLVTVSTVSCAASPQAPTAGARSGAQAGAPEQGPRQPTSAGGDCNTKVSPDPKSGSQNGAAVKKIKDRGKLIAGVAQNSNLWSHRNAKGKLVGFDIDLVKQLADSLLGDREAVEFLTVPVDRRQQALEHDEVDVLVQAMPITCRALKGTPEEPAVDFSSPYFETGQRVLVPDYSDITGFNRTLKGKTVCTAYGSSGYELLSGEGQKKYGAWMRGRPSVLDCLMLLQLSRVDAVLTDSGLAAGLAAQEDGARLVGPQIGKDSYGVAVKHGTDDLLRVVNGTLEKAGEGAWQKSYDRWLKAWLGPAKPPAPQYG